MKTRRALVIVGCTLGAVAVLKKLATRKKSPYELLSENASLDPNAEYVDVGGYIYFDGGYITPEGNTVYTGAAGSLPWYLSWGAGWLF